MNTLFRIFTTLNSFAAFYQLLLFFRHLAYGAVGHLFAPLQIGLLFLCFAMIGQMLKRMNGQHQIAAIVSVIPWLLALSVLLF